MPKGGIYGKVSSSLSSSATLDAERAAIGAVGEAKVASVLNEFAAKNRDVFVFHSVQKPGGRYDVDHLVSWKGHFLAIDAKSWQGGMEYTAVPGYTVWDDDFEEHEKHPVVKRRPHGSEEGFERFDGGLLKIYDLAKAVLRAADPKTRFTSVSTLTVISSNRVDLHPDARGLNLVLLADLMSLLEEWKASLEKKSRGETGQILPVLMQWKNNVREPYPVLGEELDFSANRKKPKPVLAPTQVDPDPISDASIENDALGVLLLVVPLILAVVSGIWFWTTQDNFWAWLIWSISTITLPFLMWLGSAGRSRLFFFGVTAVFAFFHVRHLLTVIIGG